MRSSSFSFCAFALFVIISEINGYIHEQRHGPPPLKDFVARNTANWASVTQRVDNFNPQDNRTYQMQYLYNDELYKEGGPIIIFLGGEWPIAPGYLEAGLIFDIGKQHNGFLFYTEHRYYGKSQPVNDWSAKNLAYLSVDQALADVAYFIEYAREKHNLRQSKVVLCGASYSATMATWMRIKYPHLVDAVWASSAPVVAQVDFPQYHEIAGDNIKLVSPQCYETIEQATKSMRSLIQTPEGRAKIEIIFNTCTPIKNEFPYNEYFWSAIVGLMSGMIQYSAPGNIAEHCDIIINANTTDPMEKLGHWVNIYMNGGCTGDYDEFVYYYGSSKINNGIYRQWMYQICSEFGWLQTTTSANQPFGSNQVTPNLYSRMCYDLFGPAFGLNMIDQAEKRTNNQYGGRTPALTRVVSIHGSVDPWHYPGILEDLNKDAPARLVPGSSHCADMGSIIPSNSEEMKAAKRLVVDSIARWIK